MQAQFWDDRYANNESVYGQIPNAFFTEQLLQLQPGKLLLPCEGEGRNAIYAAKNGWEVNAFDYSTVAQEKALLLAQQQQVNINYDCISVEAFKEQSSYYDAIALIYVHLLPTVRSKFHQQLINSLNKGGTLIIETFSPMQLNYQSGGPKDASMLYTIEMLQNDFQALNIHLLEYKQILLQEGSFHKGEAAVIRLVATK